jgi:hypothetical protein
LRSGAAGLSEIVVLESLIAGGDLVRVSIMNRLETRLASVPKLLERRLRPISHRPVPKKIRVRIYRIRGFYDSETPSPPKDSGRIHTALDQTDEFDRVSGSLGKLLLGESGAFSEECDSAT